MSRVDWSLPWYKRHTSAPVTVVRTTSTVPATFAIPGGSESSALAFTASTATGVGSQGRSLDYGQGAAALASGSDGAVLDAATVGLPALSAGSTDRSLAADGAGSQNVAAGSSGRSFALPAALAGLAAGITDRAMDVAALIATLAAGATDRALGLASALAGVPAGTTDRSLALPTMTAALPQGATDRSLALASTASTVPSGATDRSLALASGALGAQSAGSAGASQSVSYVINNAITYAATVTQTTGTGWTNPANAQGADDSTIASIDSSAGTKTGTLTATANWRPATIPAAVSRTQVVVRLRSTCDTTVTAAISTASATLTMTKADGSGSFTVFSSTDASNTLADTVLVARNFDITTNVVSWTDAEINGAKLLLAANFVIAAVGGGDAHWQVDSIRILTKYTSTANLT